MVARLGNERCRKSNSPSRYKGYRGTASWQRRSPHEVWKMVREVYVHTTVHVSCILKRRSDKQSDGLERPRRGTCCHLETDGRIELPVIDLAMRCLSVPMVRELVPTARIFSFTETARSQKLRISGSWYSLGLKSSERSRASCLLLRDGAAIAV